MRRAAAVLTTASKGASTADAAADAGGVAARPVHDPRVGGPQEAGVDRLHRQRRRRHGAAVDRGERRRRRRVRAEHRDAAHAGRARERVAAGVPDGRGAAPAATDRASTWASASMVEARGIGAEVRGDERADEGAGHHQQRQREGDLDGQEDGAQAGAADAHREAGALGLQDRRDVARARPRAPARARRAPSPGTTRPRCRRAPTRRATRRSSRTG